MTVEIREVRTKADKLDFLRVPFPLYRHDPHWVAPLFLERLDHLDTAKNPYFKHAEAQLFTAWRNGAAVGRISAQADTLRRERYKDGLGQFGFFDCEDNQETADALFSAAATWLKARRFTGLQGPYSFSINDEMGLLIKGFDTSPSMMMGHGQPHYSKLMDSAGFHKAKDVIAYRTDDTGQLPPLLVKVGKRAIQRGDIKLRALDKGRIDSEIAIIMDIFNDAWSENWGFVPFTPEELRKLGQDMKMLVAGGFIVIAEYKGVPSAMAVTLPNLNDWIKGFDGKILPFNWAKLLPKIIAKKPRSIRMPLMGVRKKFHDSLIGSTLAVAVIEHIRTYHIARGVKECEMSWILEDNMGMRHIIEELGGAPYKTYRIYEKAL